MPRTNNARGAIFGIDARISIAIFAALSLTAGYFALGRIEQIRNGSIIKEIKAIDNSIKHMQTDMGVFYQQAIAESDGITDFKALWDNDYVNSGFQRLWNGPYISEETRDHNILGSYYLVYYRDDMSPCENKGDCYTFIAVTETPTKVWQYINDYVDSNNGETLEDEDTQHLTGIIRTTALTEPRTLLYKSAARRVRK